MMNLVAVDFDSTLYDLTGCLARLSGDDRHLNPLDWNHCRTTCGSDEAFEVLLADAIKYDNMLHHPPYIGSLEYLSRLRDQDFFSLIVSDRPDSNWFDIYDYMQYFGFASAGIHLMRGPDKVAFCKRNEVKLLIDDRPSTLEEAALAGLPVASLRHGYNSDVIDKYNIPHGYTWAGLSKEIDNILGVSCA